MPHRESWFLMVVAVDGSTLRQPVNTRTEVCEWIGRLAPVVPLSSTWFVAWSPP